MKQRTQQKLGNIIILNQVKIDIGNEFIKQENCNLTQPITQPLFQNTIIMV